MKIKALVFPVLATFSLILASCEKEVNNPDRKGYKKGVFISCEGAFNTNNGSVSWYDTDSAGMTNNLFEMINGRPAGDVIQSFALAGDYGVIVANNSGKLEIVDLETFESTGTVTGLSYPRYFAYTGSGTGYVSNGSFAGEVYKIDVKSATVTDTIYVGMGPEQILPVNGNLFVANSGGWGYDNTVSVISMITNEVIETISVGDIPVALVRDMNNDVWVLCRGKVIYNDTWTEIVEETDSKLVKIDAGTLEKSGEVIIGETGDYFNPSWLAINPEGSILIFGESGGLYLMGINDNQQPAEPYIVKNFSAAGIHPDSGELFGVEITGYSTPGKLHIYDTGNLVSSFDTGIAPGGLVFAD